MRFLLCFVARLDGERDDRLDWRPEPTPGETAEDAIKTVTTALAGPGAPLAVQLWEAVSPGYKGRLQSWYDDLTEAINDLKDKYREFQRRLEQRDAGVTDRARSTCLLTAD